MANRPNVQKATIYSEDKKKSVVCHFNPKEFQITRAIKWIDQPRIGGNAPQKSFAGGEAQDLSIDLLFDSTDSGEDVRKSYKTLLEIAEIDKDKKHAKTKKGEPPRCRFQWGKFMAFTAVVKQVGQKFTMFKSDGTPVRATVSVTFSGVEEKPQGQNPTSRSEARRMWVVVEGQRLEWIAYQEYGDPAHWRHIAETNNLSNPMDLTPGQVLSLTPLP